MMERELNFESWLTSKYAHPHAYFHPYTEQQINFLLQGLAQTHPICHHPQALVHSIQLFHLARHPTSSLGSHLFSNPNLPSIPVLQPTISIPSPSSSVVAQSGLHCLDPNSPQGFCQDPLYLPSIQQASPPCYIKTCHPTRSTPTFQTRMRRHLLYSSVLSVHLTSSHPSHFQPLGPINLHILSSSPSPINIRLRTK